MNTPVAVCIGECMVELTGSSLETLKTSKAGFGGDTLNTAAYLAACLGNTGVCRYVTAVGNDNLSQSMLDAWQSLGVDVSGVMRIDNKLPGLYAIETSQGGERQFHYWRRDSAATTMANADNLPRLLKSLADADLIYLSGISLAILPDADRFALIDALVALAKRGTQIAFDINYRPSLWTPVAALDAVNRLGPAITVALPSIEDDALMRGQDVSTIDFWLSLGVEELVVKRGPDGVDICTGGHTQTVKPKVTREPIDTTAAGDSFNAAYLAARLHGENPAIAAAAGHRLAGEVVMHSGAIVPELTVNG